MKKIYSFIALFLMCFVGSVQAQRQWNVIDENVSEIVAGTDQYYVITGADNTKLDDQGNQVPGKDVANIGKFMTGTQQVSEPVTEAIWHFIEVDKKGDMPIYVLQNVANGKYLADSDERFTNTKAKAFRFTAQKAKAIAENALTDASTWEEYSNAVSESRSMLAEKMSAWVFCSPTERLFMCFYGVPAFANYIDTNNWFVKKAEEEAMSAYAKLVAVFGQYFAEGVSEELYPIGINPGCVSQEFYNKLETIFKEAETATANPNTPAEECDSIREAIISIFAEMETAVVAVTPGYYVVENERGGFLKDNEKGFADRKLTWPAEAWDLNSAKYIWKVEAAEVEGRILFKNFATQRYLGRGKEYKMADEPNGSFTTPHHRGTTFLLHEGGSQVNVGHNGFLCNWNDANDPGNHFKFYVVDAAVVDSMTAKVEQNAKNEALANLVNQAERDLAGLKYKNGIVEGGFYNFPTDTGLVRAFKDVYCFAKGEGSKAAPFDGKLNTYFHTAWNAADIENPQEGEQHWAKVDLGKDVKNLVIKFSKRQGAANGHINSYKLYAPEDGNGEGEYNQEIAASVDSIMYQYGDSTTHIAKYEFTAPVRYVSFVVTSTRGRDAKTWDAMTAGTGPFWHMSELRFYDADECVDNPNYVLVPEATRTALSDAIAAAKALLDESAATDAAYETLDAALKAFWEAYPDPSALKDALKVAKGMTVNAKEAENKMGFYRTGAVAALQKEVEAIEAAIKAIEDAGKALTLDEIKKYEEQLNKAIAEFNAKLVVPESGKVYRIVCKSGYVLNEDGTQKENENGELIEKGQNDACVASADADFYNGTPVWSNKVKEGDADDRFNTLWLVEKSEAGFSFKNLANGLYMNNPYQGLSEDSIKNANIPARLGYSKEPKFFNLEGFTGKYQPVDGLFLISAYKSEYVNLDPQGVVVHWYDRDDTNAAFTFSLVDEVDFSSTYKVSVQPGKIQVVSLPIELNGVVASSPVYEVLGMKDNKIHLNPVADGDVIPAGTPFIVKADAAEAGVSEGETTVDALLTVETLADAMKLTYNYEPVVKNGLVSAPFGFKAEEGAGYGVIMGNSVVATEAGDNIKAGSGFFNNTIPATTEDGELVLSVEGAISGEGTAVENVEVIKNVNSDVYTVAGVKVRQNVKAASATKNLPKGVYIVGGKKVIVK